MQKKSKREQTIFRRLLLPTLVLTILILALIYGTLLGSGLLRRMEDNSYAILSERVINRSNEINTAFGMTWTNFDTIQKEMDSLYAATTQEITPDEFLKDEEVQRQFLLQAAPSMISLLRQNDVNGVFLILNNSATYVGPPTEGAAPQEKYGLNIRDMDQNSSYKTIEDLSVERAPVALINDMGLAMDSWWSALYTFNASDDSRYFYEPLRLAFENPDVDPENLTYFCTAHNISENDVSMVSYSIPLIGTDGVPYAVLGVEISVQYLEALLPASEIGGQNVGAYVLAQTTDGGQTFTPIAANGALYTRAYGRAQQISVQGAPLAYNCWQLQNNLDLKLCASVSYITVYNHNTPFEDEQIAVLGMEESKDLLAFSIELRQMLFISFALAMVLGIMGAVILSRFISLPIQRLSDSAQNILTEDEFENLQRIGISEIDTLVNSIEELSRDISESSAKTEFFSRMSHDMRTPMNAIIGFSDQELLEGTSEAEKTEYLQKINSSGQYLLGLINEVLDISKMDSKKMELHLAPTPQSTLWGSTLPIIEEQAKQKGIHFVTDIEKDDSGRILLLDQQRMQQIFVNLLSNAVKFTPEGGTVTLKAHTIAHTEDTLTRQFIVQDSGIGMSEEFQKNLFKPFSQENTGMEGTGLGLSITKRLVELMGGTIVCYSRKGEGSQFIVTLETPYAPAGSVVTDANDFSHSEIPNLTGKHILLCEDHPLNTQIACKLLAKTGAVVECAQNGKIGVQMFTDATPGYYAGVLMDIRMPEMNGIEAAKAIRSLPRADAATVPIIAMTANAFEEDVRATTAAGMNAHLAKPIVPRLLYSALQKWLGGSAK